MDFSYSEEQTMLQSSIERFVSQDYDFEHRQALGKTDSGYSKEHWALFAELGWLMVPFSEEDEGLGGGASDILILMESLGKGLVLEPVLSTVLLGGRLIADVCEGDRKAELLGSIMDGSSQYALAFNEPQSRYNLANVATTATVEGDSYCLSGHKSVVLNGGNADQLIIVARTSGEQQDNSGISLFLVDKETSGLRIKPYATVDGLRAAEVYLDNVVVSKANVLGVVGEALPALEKVIDLATFAVCAEAVGIMEQMYKKTIEYTKTRKQFGIPLASLQALQHRMADMFIEAEQAKSIVIMAALALDDGKGVASKAVSAAKSRVGKAARLVGQEAVQLHGGMGVTDELDIAHFFKRLTAIQFLFGSTDNHTARYLQHS